ncbi:DUF3718 domain-containing protein [Thalassotalea fusca]
MKKALLVGSLMLSALNVSTAYADDSMSLRICEYIQANDKQRLRNFLKQKKVKIRNIYQDLLCNNDNILVFAAKSNSLDVGEFIIGKLPSKYVASEIDNITQHSAHLAEKAKARVK